MRQIVFVSSNGLVEAFTISESAEMERASPAVFIEVGGEIVIVPGERGIFCFPCLIHLLIRIWGNLQSVQRSLL